MEKVDIKQIERKVYLSYHNDGIPDLLIGLSFIGISLGLIYDYFGIAVIIAPVAIVLFPLLKKAITLPRLGYVKFSEGRQKREKNSMLMLTYLMSITALLGAFVFTAYTGDSSWQRWIRSLALIPFGIVLSAVAAAIGFLYGIMRAHYYALLIISTFIIGHMLDLRPVFHFIIMGLPMALIGLTLFLRFIIHNPKSIGGDSHAISRGTVQ